MSRTPSSAEVRNGLFASLAFAALGGGMLMSAAGPQLRLAGWAMLGLGLAAVVAIGARVRGRWQPEAVDWQSRIAALPLVGAIARWQAARQARGGVERLNSGAGASADGHGGWRWIDAGFAESA